MMIAVGFAIANWVGYAGSFAPGNTAWRVPLALQIPFPILLSIGTYLVPFSPRWCKYLKAFSIWLSLPSICPSGESNNATVVKKDRIEEAKAGKCFQTHTVSCLQLMLTLSCVVLISLRSDDHIAEQELIQIREQIALETIHDDTSYFKTMGHLFSKQYLRRTALCCLSIWMSQLTGAGVIQNYQNIFYAAVGFTGKKALLIMGVYGMMGVIGQIIYLVFVADKLKRAITVWAGCLSLAVMIAVCMALSAVYGSGENQAGAQAAIAMIFLYSITYAVFLNATIWVVAAEILPYFLRSQGLAFAVFSKAVVSILLSQMTPLAMAEISWR